VAPIFRWPGGYLVRQNPFVVVLLGPTGCGKSSAALELARMLEEDRGVKVELVCMDSMQVYSELEIGNTAPTRADMDRVPHHLFGFQSIRDGFSSVQWLELAKECVKDIQSRDALPLFVGGTGLYHRMLTEGVSDVPASPEGLRSRLEDLSRRKGARFLFRLLERLDPTIAKNTHPNDTQRVQRFLEVKLASGKSVQTFWGEGREYALQQPCMTFGLKMDRELLRRRISKRLDQMVVEGWLEEASTLMKMGLREVVESRGPIGYRLLFEFLDGPLERQAELIERIDVATRRYAKRQMTWFQSLSSIQWVCNQSETGYNLMHMYSKIVEFMKNSSH